MKANVLIIYSITFKISFIFNLLVFVLALSGTELYWTKKSGLEYGMGSNWTML